MSNIIELYGALTPATLGPHGVAPLDTGANMASVLQIPSGPQPKMQVDWITLNAFLPNVFNADPYFRFNNTLLRAFTNLPGTIDILLPTGRYTQVSDFADAINSAIIAHTGWYLNPANPAVSMSLNPVTGLNTVTIDTSRLAAGLVNLTLDIRRTTTGTDLADTLGFSQGTAFLSAVGPLGPHYFYGNQATELNSQGTLCDLQSTVVSTRRRNNTLVKTLAVFYMHPNGDTVWPDGGQVSPMVVYEGSKSISFVKMELKAITGNPLLFMSGSVNMAVSFTY